MYKTFWVVPSSRSLYELGIFEKTVASSKDVCNVSSSIFAYSENVESLKT
jgi:hypothetical protein